MDVSNLGTKTPDIPSVQAQLASIIPVAPATFSAEGPQLYARAYAQNAPFAVQGPYHTPLTPPQESQFRGWVSKNNVPFDPNAKIADYDMRGYWLSTNGKGWSPGQHFPDTYKTPYDTTFSRESKYATPNNPFIWKGDNLVDTRTGKVVFGRTTPPPAAIAALMALIHRG